MEEPDDGPTAEVTGACDASGSPTVSISGELDIGTVDSVRDKLDALLADGDDGVVFDLADLTFMDSSGIALLIQVANRVSTVEVRNVTPIVRRVIEVTGLGPTFGMKP
jgi:anti-sigma B factor antagonist